MGRGSEANEAAIDPPAAAASAVSRDAVSMPQPHLNVTDKAEVADSAEEIGVADLADKFQDTVIDYQMLLSNRAKKTDSCDNSLENVSEDELHGPCPHPTRTKLSKPLTQRDRSTCRNGDCIRADDHLRDASAVLAVFVMGGGGHIREDKYAFILERLAVRLDVEFRVQGTWEQRTKNTRLGRRRGRDYVRISVQ